jgi:quercetin dioxygenase-like cupin family protein
MTRDGNNPEVLEPGAGEALWFLDTLMHVKLSATTTGGALAIFEQLLPQDSATPMHRHEATDEHFYVLAGEVTFHGPAGARRCGAGAFVSVPRGTNHAFRVTAGPARLLVLSTPGTFEQFVRAVSRPAAAAILPDAPPPTAADIDRLAVLGAQTDVILLGPPPVMTP